ncbi:MAG: exosortase/archaeosortase family protein [Opitutaceae bacterium]
MSTPAPSGPGSRLRNLTPTNIGVLVAMGVAAAALTWHLWPHWSNNPDLSHGYFVPLLFALLLAESRSGTPRTVRPGIAAQAGLGALLLLALAAVFIAGLYAATVYWSHAAVSLMLALGFALFVLAAGLVFASPDIALVRFNWPLFVAATLWILAAPLPPGTYSRLTLSLQLWVSESVLETLHLLGIAAARRGNIIDLVHATVGVEEACSGVRSLISCVFAALFFSATLVHRPWARALIIALAPLLALGMNFIRSLALTLMAGAKVDISGFWHDATGFAVLGVTSVILGGLALLLERTPRPEKAAVPTATPLRIGSGSIYALGAGMAGAAAILLFFIWNTRPVPPNDAPPPDVAALLPTPPPGWAARTPNLFAFSGTLQTSHLAQRDYLEQVSGGGSHELVIYVAYWRAGQAPVSLVASHTPDACWPGAGWEAVPIPQTTVALSVNGRRLPDAEQRVFRSGGQPYNVWFWHLHGGNPIAFRDPYSATELLRYAWRYGFQRDADQLFVRISSNRPWSEIAPSPVLREFFDRAAQRGLLHQHALSPHSN